LLEILSREFTKEAIFKDLLFLLNQIINNLILYAF